MSLIKELQPPQINEKLLPEVMKLLEDIARMLEEYTIDIIDDEIILESKEGSDNINRKKARLEELTKKDINSLDILNYQSACSTEDFAREILMPEPPYIADITLEQLTELIHEFETLEHISAEHEMYHMKLLEKSFGLNDIVNYIFWPNTKGMTLDAEADEIARKIIEDSKNNKIYSR